MASRLVRNSLTMITAMAMAGMAHAQQGAGPAPAGRFAIKELMPVVDPEMADIAQVYMCADERIRRSEMEPSLNGGVTKTRVAVRSDKEGSAYLILIGQPPGYRMYQAFRRGYIVRALSWAGAEHILLGSVSFGGFRFDSDPLFPLHLKLVQHVGYVHLCGRGTVTTPRGQRYSLAYHRGVKDWLSALGSRDQLSREAATEALGWLTKTKSDAALAVPALMGALEDEAMEVRRDAAEALGRIGDPRAGEALQTALQDQDEWVREVAADALRKLGDKVSR